MVLYVIGVLKFSKYISLLIGIAWLFNMRVSWYVIDFVNCEWMRLFNNVNYGTLIEIRNHCMYLTLLFVQCLMIKENIRMMCDTIWWWYVSLVVKQPKPRIVTRNLPLFPQPGPACMRANYVKLQCGWDCPRNRALPNPAHSPVTWSRQAVKR